MAVVLVAAVHVGLAGSVFAESRWTGLAANVVVVLVAVKIALIAVARFKIRQRRAAKRPDRAALDLDDEQVAQAVQDAIRDATSDAERYLGYPLIPLTATDTGLWPPPYRGEWKLSQEPVNTIVQVTAELDAQLQPTGLYAVEYLYGRDAREAEYAPIRPGGSPRLLRTPTRWCAGSPTRPPSRRRVKSVSAEGQSVT